jgi:chemotaxis protein methyltransferase CheR
VRRRLEPPKNERGPTLTKDFTLKDLQRLAEISRQETGVAIAENQYHLLESRLGNRISELGLVSVDAYWSHFAKHEAEERSAILSLMTTHHTFFFREFIHFELLEKWVDTNAARLKERFAKDKTPLKIWSAACSRGHEVHSLAMFLEFACFEKYGIPFEVLGSDIDPECVNEAKNGVYPVVEVCKIPQKYLNSFWVNGVGVTKGSISVGPRIRGKTKFEVTNLLKLQALSSSHRFDVIFVRNVFIYFSAEQVQKIALDLRGRLMDGGLFITGVSEPISFPAWDLQSIGPSAYTTKAASPAKREASAGAAAQSRSKLNDPSKGTIPETTPTKHHAAVGVARLASLPTVAVPVTTYRVLCVDDSSTIQAVMKHVFTRDKDCVEFVSAMNGAEARKKLDAAPSGAGFNIITLDIHMPVMGGIEFLETCYRPSIDPPVLMISSVNRADVDLATKALSLGASDYVEKPAMNKLEQSSDEILAKVKMILKDREAIDSPADRPLIGKDDQGKSATDHRVSGLAGQMFTQGISQKILIQDASKCMRWIKMNAGKLSDLKYILDEQKKERRSPAMVLSVPEAEISQVMIAVHGWTNVKAERLSAPKSFLRASSIYVCDEKLESELVSSLVVKSFSLQILSAPKTLLECFAVFRNKAADGSSQDIQILLDESLGDSVAKSVEKANLVVSEITPSTSFISLSIEFFANLRRLAS